MATTQQSYQRLTKNHKHSLWRVLPWTGIISLLLALCCGVAALVIGVVSNGLPLGSWAVSARPSVLLSTAATLANALLRIAFFDGITIQWWSQAVQGVSVGELCALYIHGYSTKGLFTMLSKFSRVTLAAFVMLLLLADGPILQRASSVHIVSHQSLNNLTVSVSPSPFVWGATGIITTHDGEEPNIYTTMFAQVMQRFSARDPISIPNLSYPGTITMNLIGPGWDIQCNNGSSPYELMSMEQWSQWNNSRNPDYVGPPWTQTVFDVTVDYTAVTEDSPSTILIQTSYKSTLGINGTQLWRNCSLAEAIIRYPVQVVDGVVTLQSMPLSENRTESLVYREIELNGFGNAPSTVGGFWIALQDQFATSANVSVEGEVQKAVVSNENSLANQFVTAGSDLLDGYNVAWSDPIDTIIAAANEISLRAAIDLTYQTTSFSCATCMQPQVYSPNLTLTNRTISQTASASTISSSNAYQTDMAWLISGCAIIALACVAVAPMYWGWWGLKRRFTLNPLETANAFDAPLLRDITSDTSPTEWNQSVRNTRVHYGTGVYNPPDTAADSTRILTGEPLKVFALETTQENRFSSMSNMDSIMDTELNVLGQQSKAATTSGPKFRKID